MECNAGNRNTVASSVRFVNSQIPCRQLRKEDFPVIIRIELKGQRIASCRPVSGRFFQLALADNIDAVNQRVDLVAILQLRDRPSYDDSAT